MMYFSTIVVIITIFTNLFHVITPTEKMDEYQCEYIEKINICGKPSTTFVRWSDVRIYLNDQAFAKIPGNVQGPPLPVKHCINELSPCCSLDSYCTVKKQKYSMHKLPLYEDSKPLGRYIALLYVEDEECECVDKETHDAKFNSLGSVPPILAIQME